MKTTPEAEPAVALVTGASNGIGRAIALALADEGFHLALVARASSRLTEVLREVEQKGAHALAIAEDLADPEAPRRIVQTTLDRFSRLDLLINNAGQARKAAIEETDAGLFDLLMAVNARAPLLLCQQALSALRKSRRPCIINIASVAAHQGYIGESAYAASKHALLGFSRVLARELHRERVRVHVISPGGVNSGMSAEMDPNGDQDLRMDPEDVAQAVCFLIRSGGKARVDELRLRRVGAEPSF